MKRVILSICMCVAVGGCSVNGNGETHGQERTSGLGLAGMNLDVRPQDDFFHYVNGTWIADTEIPDDHSRWGAFDILREKSKENIKNIVAEVTTLLGDVPKVDAIVPGGSSRSASTLAGLNVIAA